MRVVIAPDKFKGSLSAPDVAEHLATGLLAGYGHNGFEATRIPVADGGEGTIDAAIGSGFTRRTTTVTGPLGEPVKADFAVRDQEAVIEMAAASGLALLPDGPTSETAKTATSIGTGELIRAALDLGCRKIILGVGGSANTDAGAGVLQGLGAVFLDENGNELPGGGAALAQLNSIDFSNFDVRVEATEFVLASDVDNPLWGPAEHQPSSVRRRARRRTTSPRSTRHSATSSTSSQPQPGNTPSTQPKQKAPEQQAALATLPSRH